MSRDDVLERLVLRTPRLELRVAGIGEGLDELYEVALAGVHPPEEMPFAVPWTDGLDQPGRRQEYLDYHLDALAGIRADHWHVLFCIREGGAPIGIQGVEADRFAETREVSTGSWLGRLYQGRGLGTEMRAAVLELAFEHLGAQRATSGAIDGNVASRRVSDKLGYRQVGVSTVAPRGVDVGHADLELTRADWQAHRSIPVEVDGVTPELLALLGA
ncbi:MAG: GNAT family N-acetyltransferase [Gaiellales bacterium]